MAVGTSSGGYISWSGVPGIRLDWSENGDLASLGDVRSNRSDGLRVVANWGTILMVGDLRPVSNDISLAVSLIDDADVPDWLSAKGLLGYVNLSIVV